MKNSLKFFAVLAVMASLAFALPNKEDSKQITIVIDAGHGGKDHGATHETFTEKQIVNQIAEKVKMLNKDKDITISFTKSSDEFVSLQERVRAINNAKPDLVLSLHVNYLKSTETANGMEFFVGKEAVHKENAQRYAKLLEEKFVADNYKSRGIKEAPLYILKNSEAPAISFQIGFLSNSADRAYLTDAAKQEEIAETVLEFIRELK